MLIYMKVSIMVKIDDSLIKKIMEYTNSSTVTEAVNFALKDCVLVYKMRERNINLTKKTNYINKFKEIIKLYILILGL